MRKTSGFYPTKGGTGGEAVGDGFSTLDNLVQCSTYTTHVYIRVLTEQT